MRVMSRANKRTALALGLVVAGWATSVRADGESFYFPNQPGGNGDSDGEDIDFQSSSIPTATTGALSGKKYWILNLATYNSQPQCFTIRTLGDGSGDTRIWIYDFDINDYRSLNDDNSSSDRYSTANIWISPPANGGQYVSPVISSYSSGYNAMKFSVSIFKLTAATTEAQCTVGSTYKSTTSGTSFINAT
jgi:hypothetical protein